MSKRHWKKDRQLQKITRQIIRQEYQDDPIVQSWAAGRTLFSEAADKPMPPTNNRKIDPKSPEGKKIAAKYNF